MVRLPPPLVGFSGLVHAAPVDTVGALCGHLLDIMAAPHF